MTDPDPTTPDATSPEAPAEVADGAQGPVVPVGKPAQRYNARFLVLYGILAAIAIAAIAGFVVLVAKPNSSTASSAKGWSDWKPSSGSDCEHDLADRRPRGARVPPEQEGRAARSGRLRPADGHERDAQGLDLAHRDPALAAERQRDQGRPVGDDVDDRAVRPRQPVLDLLRDSRARPAAGSSAARRSRSALYTFKFVPAIDSVVAFMPPPAGQTPVDAPLPAEEPAREPARRAAARRRCRSQTPPLPTMPDTKEAATIDKLTLPAVYSYKLQQLQDASALLVLDPFQS